MLHQDESVADLHLLDVLGHVPRARTAKRVWGTGSRVQRAPGAAPTVRLHGATARIAAERGIARIHVTITHDAGLAAAVAVAEGTNRG